MPEKVVGVTCRVVEWTKKNKINWYGHVRRLPEEKLAVTI